MLADISEMNMRIMTLLLITFTLSTVAAAQTSPSPEPKAEAQDQYSAESKKSDLALTRFRAKSPAITLKRALRLAEEYIKRQKINITPYYLREAKLVSEGVENGNKESSWWFRWVRPNGALGDYVEIGVSMEGKVWRMASM